MRKFFVLALLSIFILLPFVSQASAQWFQFQNPMLGKQVEDFTLENLSGESKKLSVLSNDQPVIIFFWATWCPHCREKLVELKEKAGEFKQKNIKVILVDLGEEAGRVEKYISKNGISFDVVLDQYGDVAGDYGVQGVPTFFFVNEKGTVKAVEYELPGNYEEILEIQ